MTRAQFYHGKAWRRLSKAFLMSKHYICERCGQPAEIAHHKIYLTAENVALCHENGICVNCWTVDSAEDAAMLIGYGVDYITSNILE